MSFFKKLFNRVTGKPETEAPPIRCAGAAVTAPDLEIAEAAAADVEPAPAETELRG